MLCLACAGQWGWPLCRACRVDLRPGPQFILDGRILVAAAFHHHGAARRLVHRLKYGALVDAARVLATAMAPHLPRGATTLVPVPRAIGRRIRHGIDPAVALASELSRITGAPIVHCLGPSLWWPRHATQPAARRRLVRFRTLRPVPSGAVLVDDVVTSGATLLAAQRALGGVAMAVTATSPGPGRIRSSTGREERPHDSADGPG
ncbi:MAG: hypothetical protein QNJ88_13105 [Acidimicrobiia bacterium]|nr:hypothetical protein [Acidimicrobiia bacterium]